MRSARPRHVHGSNALLRLVEAVNGSLRVDDLLPAYLQHMPRVIPAVAHGFYLLTPGTGQPYWVETVGTTNRFLYRYELVRDVDPLIPHVRNTRRSTDTETLLPPDAWRRHPMAEVFTEAGYARYLLGLLWVGGNVVGTLNLARSPGEPSFTEEERSLLDRVCRTVAVALGRVLEFSRLEARASALEAAVTGLRTPVLVLSRAGDVQYADHAARELLDRFGHAGGAALLEVLRAAARQLSPDDRRTCTLRHPLPAPDGRSFVAGELVVRLVLVGGRLGSVVAYLHPHDAARAQQERVSGLLHGWSGMLTRQERRVVSCLAEGLTNAGIAARLRISENTVKRHLKNLYAKFGVSSRAGLVARIMGE